VNSRGETNGLGELPERPKSVRVFRHLFHAGPDIVTGEIDVFPARRGQMDQQMIRDIFCPAWGTGGTAAKLGVPGRVGYFHA
jgi:hypothetical protein